MATSKILMESQKQLPPGFRFRPRDDELIQEYLEKMVAGEPFRSDVIPVIEHKVYADEPWEFSEAKAVETGEFYCITRRRKKHPRGKKVDRTAEGGFWKATGGEKKIVNSKKQTIGYKQSLVFMIRSQRSLKGHARSSWVMDEYRLHGSGPKEFEEWVLRRIKKSNRRATADPEESKTTAAAAAGGKEEEMMSEADLVVPQVSDGIIEQSGEQFNVPLLIPFEETAFNQTSQFPNFGDVPIYWDSQLKLPST